MADNNLLHAVTLRHLSIDDFPVVLEWSKDEEFCLSNGWETYRNPDELFSWWEYCVRSSSDDFIRLGIDYKDTLVGYVDMVCHDGQTGELGIAIGNRSLWGKGIGIVASEAMMAYVTKEQGITSFIAETHESNQRARRFLEKLGFIETSRIGCEEYKGAASRLLQYKLRNKSGKPI